MGVVQEAPLSLIRPDPHLQLLPTKGRRAALAARAILRRAEEKGHHPLPRIAWIGSSIQSINRRFSTTMSAESVEPTRIGSSTP